MCNPMAIMAGMMAVQTVAGMGQQNMQYDMAKQQAAAQNRMYEQNRQNAYKALSYQYSDIGERQDQERQSASQEKEERARAARAAMARARVAAGEAGIYGNTVSLGLRDISGAASRDFSTLDRNLTWTLSDLQRQKRSARTSTINQINSVPTGQRPSSTARYLGMASTAAQGAAGWASMAPQNKPINGGWMSQVQTT